MSLVFLLAGLIPAWITAAEPDAAAVTGGLQEWLDGSRTLAGRFQQRLVSGAFGADEIESGMLYIRRPGTMRWDYTDPEEKTVLVFGRETLMYFAEDEQMIRGALDEESELLPSLLAGGGRISDLFDAELQAKPGDGESLSFRLRLVPGGDDDPFEEVVLLLAPGDYAIEAAEVLDGAGNRMIYIFPDLRRNVRLPDGIFSFEPPPGTEIIEGY
jgi:outer membrane lipoprotein carrier protein